MIRFIFREIDNRMMAVGAAETGEVLHRTLDVDLPEVEKMFKDPEQYIHRQFVGIELLQPKESA